MLQQMGYLWGVTAVVWIGTIAYVVHLVRRQHHLQRQLEELEKSVAQLN